MAFCRKWRAHVEKKAVGASEGGLVDVVFCEKGPEATLQLFTWLLPLKFLSCVLFFYFIAINVNHILV